MQYQTEKKPANGTAQRQRRGGRGLYPFSATSGNAPMSRAAKPLSAANDVGRVLPTPNFMLTKSASLPKQNLRLLFSLRYFSPLIDFAHNII